MSVLEVVFLIVFWSWVLSSALFLRNTFLPRMPLMSAPESLGLYAETINFSATDGLRLEGWVIRGQADSPWIIMCHGVGANRADLLHIAAGLHAKGFNLFLFDFRAHGGSAGRTTSFGYSEQRDLEGALVYLGSQSAIPARPYGFYGISMGAATGILVAARDERIGAVVADSPYTNLDFTILHHMNLMYRPIPTAPLRWFIMSTYRLRFGVWPSNVSPEKRLREIAPRPILLIQGGQDPRMPIERTRKMFSNALEPKELWIVPGGKHLEAYGLEPEEYLNRLTSFYHNALGIKGENGV